MDASPSKEGLVEAENPVPAVKEEPQEQFAGDDEVRVGQVDDDASKSESESESGSMEEQIAFIKELAKFYGDRKMEFGFSKFYGEDINWLKLWRVVQRLGGSKEVTARKLWRQVGMSFNPPKTCTALAWLFRNFYEKTLLIYEMHKTYGDHHIPASPLQESMSVENLEKQSVFRPEHEVQITTFGSLKRKNPYNLNGSVNRCTINCGTETQIDDSVVDNGPDDDWVKIYARKSKFASGARQYMDLGRLEERLKVYDDALAVSRDKLIRLKLEVEATEKEIETLKQGRDDSSKAVAEARGHLKQLEFFVVGK